MPQNPDHKKSPSKLQYMKKIDVFSKPISLQFDQKEDYQTFCGALMTILIIVVCVIYFIIQVYNYFTLKNPNIIVGQLPLGDRSIEIGDKSQNISHIKDFSIVLALRDINKTSFVDPSIYTISAIYKEKYTTANPNGTFNINYTLRPQNVVSCDPSLKIFQNTLIRNEVQNYLCVNLTNGVNLKGQFQNNLFDFISIKVMKCQNTSQLSICKSNETIEKKMQGSIFSVFFTDTVLDFSNAQADIFQNIIGEAHSTYSNIVSTELSVYLEPITVQTNIFDLFPAEKREATKYDRVKENTQFQQKDYIFSVIFRLSTTQTVYNLNNSNIIFVLSQIGGLWNFLTILGGLLITPFRDFSRKLSIVNRIFLFEPSKKDKPNNILPEGQKEEEETQFQKIRLSILEYFTFFFPNKYCIGISEQKLNQIDYASQQIWPKLDIVYILKKMNQIDRLISTLLPKSQQLQIQELQRRVIKLDVIPKSQRLRNAQRRIQKQKKNRILPMQDDDANIFEDNFLRNLRVTIVSNENTYDKPNAQTTDETLKRENHLDSSFKILTQQQEEDEEKANNQNDGKQWRKEHQSEIELQSRFMGDDTSGQFSFIKEI